MTRAHCDKCDAVIPSRDGRLPEGEIDPQGSYMIQTAVRVTVEVLSGNTWHKRDICAACLHRIADLLDPSPREAKA